MTIERIRWGILSTADIGKAEVIPAIQHSRNGVVTAVASRDGDRAKNFAVELKIPKAYSTYEELLQDEDVDALYIPLPNSLHKGWTIKALDAGKHVLCEKPLALNAVECMDMDSAAKYNHRKLMEAFMYRFHPRMEKAFEMVQGGLIGDISLLDASFNFHLRTMANIRMWPELGGGALMDVGCYCVNSIRTAVGREPVGVIAHAVWIDTGVDDQLVGVLDFGDGIQAHFDCGFITQHREYFIINGSKGWLEIPHPYLPGMGNVDILLHKGQNEFETITVEGTNEYQCMVEHFSDCILNNKEVRYPVNEAAKNMRVIEALLKSARHNSQYTLIERG